MTEQDIAVMRDRLRKYDELNNEKKRLMATLQVLEGHMEARGPFTGNTRESRDILEMKIVFSNTVGGGNSVEIYLSGLDYPAHEMGQALYTNLRKKIKNLSERMEKL